MASKAITERIQSLTDRELQEQILQELILNNRRLKDVSFNTGLLLTITIFAIAVGVVTVIMA